MWGELRDLGGRKGRAGNWIIYWWDDWFAACASGREKQPDFRAVLRAAELLVSQIYGFWLYLCSACPFSWVTWDVVVLSACLGKPLLFLPHPCNGKFLQSLHGASLNDVSSPRLLAPDPSASAHFGTSWVCSTVGWGGAICLEVIPTYWKPSPHLYFGQMSLPGSSGLSLLACNTQAPRGWWVPYTDVPEGTTASWCSLSSTVFQQWCESKMGFAFWNISSFCFWAGRNEISPSTSALLFILFSALSLSGSVAHLVMSLQTLGQGIVSPDFSYLKLRHKV